MYQLPNFEEDLSPARCCKNRGGRLRWNNIPIALNASLVSAGPFEMSQALPTRLRFVQ